MRGRIENQGKLSGQISRAHDNLKKLGQANITRGVLEARIENFNEKWKKFETEHEMIEADADDDDRKLAYFTTDFFSTAEECFLTQKGKLLDCLRVFTERSHDGESARVESASVARQSLPKINIPKFSGLYTEWLNFRDLFMSMVIDAPLSQIERMHYLKTSLTKEASSLIASMPSTADNFDTAWQTLTTRYDNIRLLTVAQIATLFSLPAMTSESSAELKVIFNGTSNALGALKALKRPVDAYSDFVVYMTVQKLDKQSRREWEASVGSKKNPSTFAELQAFLENRICSIEALEGPTKPQENPTPSKTNSSNSSRQKKSSPPSTHQGVQSLVSTNTATAQKCALCQQGHFVLFCDGFRQKSAEDRKAFVMSNKLCLNCLGQHYVRDCRSTKICQKCKEKHHTTLHDTHAPATSLTNNSKSPTEKASTSTTTQVTTHHTNATGTHTGRVILATALLHVSTHNEEKVMVRALIDQGSEATFVSESLAQRLQLPRSSASVPVTGIGASAATTSRGAVTLCISSRFNPNFNCQVNALVLPKLTAYQPPRVTLTSQWSHLRGIYLADPDFLSSRPIELLLGADVYAQLILDGVRRGSSNSPIAQNTQLGWIISGRIAPHVASCSAPVSMQVSLDTSLTSSLQRFWEQEEITPALLKPFPEDDDCEQHFLATHSRTNEGRYVVRLPFKRASESLGDSLTPATTMLQRMERRFSRDTVFRDAYSAFMTEYETLRHMELVPQPEPEARNCYYLPHHGVIRESSTTTKLRVVFNGSQKTTSGISLNEHLHVGPKILPELVHILLRWRSHKIVFSADMEKMYRQILLHEDDRDFQRILWRDNANSTIDKYRLRTVTYGLSCAPFLALRVIRQLATDEKDRYPIGATALLTDVYVDDVLSGADDIPAARTKQKELIELLKAGGFSLRKWTSNAPELLNHLTPDHTATSTSIVWQPETFHMLGLSWQSSSDSFLFQLKSTELQPTLTKRNVLSQIAQLFDPFGWLAPVTILAKIFMQSLWLLKIDWDDPLPSGQARQWRRIHSDLPAISTYRIPRWLNVMSTSRSLELHGFADASERAYAAVLYLRVTDETETSAVLIMAKTKVAPVKQVSVPRVELCAAQLATRLAKTVLETLSLDCTVHLWSDSTVALAWIRDHPTRWKTYVANRVADIQITLPNALWHHVDSKDNPADCASRGVFASELQNHPLWWSGPEWLTKDSPSWPSLSQKLSNNPPEERCASHTSHVERKEPNDLLTRYSSLTRLLRITAWCRRIISSKTDQQDRPRNLQPSEIEDSLQRLIRVEQERLYGTEIRALQSRSSISKGPLLPLNPFIDEKGLLRVGGRLKNATLDQDGKHPLIIPRDSPLSKLLIEQCHKRTLHGGVQLTLGTLRQRYWLIGGRTAVKAVIHQCKICTRFRAATATPLMGNLPTNRVTKSRAFQHTGVDYAGPILLRTAKGRGHKAYKAYIAVFVCFSTRAVHLEAVSDYTADSFLAAFRRFVSRRGKCTTLTSDNGTNFVGADSELRDLFAQTSAESTKISNSLANDGTLWKFNPPSAPHFGGLWEAAVKSVKHHLRRVIGESTLTYEEMSTLLSQVEACLNSRPLQALSDDPDDLSALTPAHFLIGEPLTAVPEPSLTDVPISRLSRWQLIQQMQRHFWNRWSAEYLHQLQTRPKWQRPQAPLQVGDLVLIKNELLPPTKWPLARITAVHPGNDGNIRVATVKTATSSYTRPVVKLCLLLKNEVNQCGE